MKNASLEKKMNLWIRILLVLHNHYSSWLKDERNFVDGLSFLIQIFDTFDEQLAIFVDMLYNL